MQQLWQPQTAGVEQICQLLAAYQSPGSNQAQILSQLDQCRAFPDFNNYLAYIFAQGDGYPIEVRQSAGLLLKNNLKQQYASASAEYQQYLKVALAHAIGHNSKELRRTAGTNIGVVVAVGGLAQWPELIALLVQCLEGASISHVLGGLDTLYKICEDSPHQLERPLPALNGTSSNALVPRLMALFQSHDAEARCLAVACINLMAGNMPNALADGLDQYIQGLFNLAYDASNDVRKAVCTGLVQLLTLQPDRLESQMADIIEYMLRCTQDGDEGVALESCEFWSAFCDAQLDPAVMRPFLPRLVPVLLKNMVFEEHDEEVTEAEMADEQSHPLPADGNGHDLKPFIHRGRGEEDDEEDGEEVVAWNLRKCSAAGLDVLSTVFGDELLPIVLPIVQAHMQSADWRARESATLALGAIAEGCAQGLLPYLQDMVSTLLAMLGDPRPLVRSITCWALSRYSQWIVTRAKADATAPANGAAGGTAQFEAVLQALLAHVTDRNRKVQEAACSALATLEEAAGGDIAPYVKPILTTLGTALPVYSRRNLRILYDALSTLAEAAVLHTHEHRVLLMPPLMAKWDSLADDDKELLPLLECFTAVAQALGPAFEDYAVATFSRCIRIISAQLAAAAADADHDKQAITCALDVVSGVTEALGAGVESLVAASPLVELLMQCCQDPSPDVRQSAFALVGDMAKSCPARLTPNFKQLVALTLHALDPSTLRAESLSASNNACWALGELAVKVPVESLQPAVAPLAERLVPILASPAGGMPRSILENSAITLGRVAWMCPEPLAGALEHFIWPWCQVLRSIRDDLEKEHAFLGLCRLLRLNPQGALGGFAKLCEAIVSWHSLRCEGLANELVQIMRLYKTTLESVGQWDGYMGQLEPAVRDKLVRMCGL